MFGSLEELKLKLRQVDQVEIDGMLMYQMI